MNDEVPVTPVPDPTLERLAEELKALAHPTRLAILRLLAGRTCVCGEIVNGLPLAQATVSQHLKVLKEAGFIRGEIAGPRTCYCLDTAGLERFRAAVEHLLDQLAIENRSVASCEPMPEENPA